MRTTENKEEKREGGGICGENGRGQSVNYFQSFSLVFQFLIICYSALSSPETTDAIVLRPMGIEYRQL